MDFNLAAVKLFCSELKDARPCTGSSPSAMTLFGDLLFQRAWLQGVLVTRDEEGRFILDDGSAVVKLSMELTLTPGHQPQEWSTGMYVMVVGIYMPPSAGDLPLVKVHKMVDLSACPDREAMWQLEVIEAHSLFYLSSLQ